MMTHRQKGILERAFERAEARARGIRPRIEDLPLSRAQIADWLIGALYAW
jgi:hypothetical protein